MAVALDRQELVALIADVLDLNPDVITDDAHFITDLGVDSLLALELAVALERRYQIKIESTEIVDVESLRDVIALLEQKLTIAV
ncbi:acyl carrier protein [Micromonospora sp. WMMD1120]|uniref:acyl carrier protein n=1 Tax=Micromonospora sp. WMMD1120 TaxID=3016106 RepID=UPI002416430F|nr:acyl carrier protein [Micromonospora sp. WMMD1120]MDG4810830.1 acyl carrier protein [Micromonospora sp. WMMD1120]